MLGRLGSGARYPESTMLASFPLLVPDAEPPGEGHRMSGEDERKGEGPSISRPTLPPNGSI